MSLGDITGTMQMLLGSAYVNDFDFNNRSYRVYVQADQQFRIEPGGHRALLRADARRADDAAQQRRRRSTETTRAEERSRTTTCSARRDQRVGGAGLQLRPGAADDGGAVEPGAAAGVDVRVVGPVARGDQGGQAVGGDLRPRPAARLPDAGGAVREPHAAVHHPAVGAARDPRRAAGAVGPRADQRRLLPDRAGDADRPVGEERHPHRRVRRAAARRAGCRSPTRRSKRRASGCGRF